MDLQLMHRLKELARVDLPAVPSPLTGQRRWSELVAIAADLERQHQQAAKADARKNASNTERPLPPKPLKPEIGSMT